MTSIKKAVIMFQFGTELRFESRSAVHTALGLKNNPANAKVLDKLIFQGFARMEDIVEQRAVIARVTARMAVEAKAEAEAK